MNWLHDLETARLTDQCLALPEGPLPGSGRALALSPHPDDPDAVAVLLRSLQQGGWEVHWTILTSGWSGVEDAFAGPSRAEKGRVRQAEQRDSARLFGLPEDRLVFLALDEDEAGDLQASAANYRRYADYLTALQPALVVLPWEEDTNPSHRLNYAWLVRWAARYPGDLLALGNEDPKTTNFRPHLQLTFGEETAAWKASLLECHRSQSTRNQRTRGITFAERILNVNTIAPGQYAERFRAQRFTPRSAVWG
jgi:LmbE family N-acetylglucosaminyl deacetylase